MFCQNFEVPAYGPVNHENQMSTHKHDKASNLINIQLLLVSLSFP